MFYVIIFIVAMTVLLGAIAVERNNRSNEVFHQMTEEQGRRARFNHVKKMLFEYQPVERRKLTNTEFFGAQ